MNRQAKKIISILLVILISVSTMPVTVFAESKPDVVYTGLNSGAEDGSKDNPYSELITALENVSEGGTIYIKGGSFSFVNDIENSQPFVINKAVTIATEPGASSKGAITSRSAGIALGADVTFSNIDIGLANKYHNVICANGYQLVLDNVGAESGHKPINVFAGGIADLYGNPYSEPGNHASVTIKGKDSHFDNLYAGGLNCSYNGDVVFDINGEAGMVIGSSYSCGAVETYVDMDNWFDFTDPEPPTPNANYATKNVVWNLNQAVSKVIDGTGSESTTVNIRINPDARESNIKFNGIDNLNVLEGTLEPMTLNDGANISIGEYAALDLKNISKYSCNHFTSNGTLILDTVGQITINGIVEGTTAFVTKNGYEGVSGTAIANHTYIVAENSNDSSFTFIPCTVQSWYVLILDNGCWNVIEGDDSALKKDFSAIDFYDQELSFTETDANTGNSFIPFSVACSNDAEYIELYYFDYVVKYNGKEYLSKIGECSGEAMVEELNMKLDVYTVEEPQNNTMQCQINLYGYNGTIAAGTYEITMLYGNVSDTIIVNMNHEFVNGVCSFCGIEYVDTSALRSAVSLAESLDSSRYSERSYAALFEIVHNSKKLLSNAVTQQEIDHEVAKILTAVYDLEAYFDLHIASAVGGTSSMTGDYALLKGTSVDLTAKADDGYGFVGWYDSINNRYFSTSEEYSFILTANTSLKPVFVKLDSATLTFSTYSNWIQSTVTKTTEEWAGVTDISALLPEVPYRYGYSNGRWVYDNNEVLSKLMNGEDVTLIPVYDDSAKQLPSPKEPVDGKPVLDLYYDYDSANSVGSFVMAAGIPQDIHIVDIGIAFYYGRQEIFDPNSFTLMLDNKTLCSRFNTDVIEDIYIVNINHMTARYNWCARGYATFYDADGNLKTVYSNQINIKN